MELGINVATIDDVARRLGATKGRIYHHFPSKDALVSHVRLQAPLHSHRAVQAVIRDDLPPDRNIHNMARAHIATALRLMPYYKVYLAGGYGVTAKTHTAQERVLQADVRQASAAYEDLYRAVLLDGMDQGLFARRNLSALVHSLLVLINAPVIWYSPSQATTSAFHQQIVDDVSDMALSSLR